jgi:putative phosphoesterase
MKLAILSDTHGLLRSEVIDELHGCDHILHAADVGDPSILIKLGRHAPLTAIRGNVDTAGACSRLPETEIITLGGHTFYMLHNLRALDLDPVAAGIDCVISGHTHTPLIERRKGVLYFNPGSCGPRRFSLPISLGILQLTPSAIEPQLITLLPD